MVVNFTNAQINDYFLHTEIGRGGMSRVYQATKVDTGQEVAVKIVNNQTTDMPSFERRFAREVKALNQLKHPGILSLIDSGTTEDGTLFMVMPLIENGTLSHFLKEHDVLTPMQAQQLVDQIGNALDYAHSQGIIHRDIKPHNIMILEDGSFSLADFGIAAMSNMEGTAAGLTTTGETFGTVAYMSPEQIAGDPVDGRADLYALGIVLYQSLIGRLPFMGENTATLLSQQLYALPIAPHLLNPDFPVEVEIILEKALAKNPDERYQTGAELAAALGNAVTKLPLEMRDFPLLTYDQINTTVRLNNVLMNPSIATRQEVPPRRRVPLLILGAIILTILACAVVVIPIQNQLANAQSGPGATPTAAHMQPETRTKDSGQFIQATAVRSPATVWPVGPALPTAIPTADPGSSGDEGDKGKGGGKKSGGSGNTTGGNNSGNGGNNGSGGGNAGGNGPGGDNSGGGGPGGSSGGNGPGGDSSGGSGPGGGNGAGGGANDSTDSGGDGDRGGGRGGKSR